MPDRRSFAARWILALAGAITITLGLITSLKTLPPGVSFASAVAMILMAVGAIFLAVLWAAVWLGERPKTKDHPPIERPGGR